MLIFEITNRRKFQRFPEWILIENDKIAYKLDKEQ